MAALTRFHAPPQDAIYGVDHANIVPRLTADNWQTRATVRVQGSTSLYVWIAQGTRGEDEVYAVRVDGHEERCRDLRKSFATLTAALAYANGEDGGGLAATAPALQSEFPPDRGPTIVVSGLRSKR